MAGAISRAQFLRGDFNNHHSPIRPPWSRPESQFIETCTQCSDCLSSCPKKIISKGSGNYPVIDFSLGECTFCFECVDSCAPQALSGTEDSTPWNLKAIISNQCLVYAGVHCMTCRDQCETEAITFIANISKPPYPVIDQNLCSGCGACFQPCPNQSIKLNYQLTNKSAKNSHLKETAL